MHFYLCIIDQVSIFSKIHGWIHYHRYIVLNLYVSLGDSLPCLFESSNRSILKTRYDGKHWKKILGLFVAMLRNLKIINIFGSIDYWNIKRYYFYIIPPVTPVHFYRFTLINSLIILARFDLFGSETISVMTQNISLLFKASNFFKFGVPNFESNSKRKSTYSVGSKFKKVNQVEESSVFHV